MTTIYTLPRPHLDLPWLRPPFSRLVARGSLHSAAARFLLALIRSTNIEHREESMPARRLTPEEVHKKLGGGLIILGPVRREKPPSNNPSEKERGNGDEKHADKQKPKRRTP